MRASMTRTAAALALLSATGCVYASKIAGPGGGEAFRIHCSTPEQCTEKAVEVCGGDYQRLSSSSQMDGYANNGTGYAQTPHEIVIACRAGGGGTGSSSASAPPKAPPATPSAEPASAASTCAAAHRSVKETAAFWAQLHPDAKRLDEPPSQRDFLEVCRALPERIQRCLDAGYRDAHPKPCLAVLRRLDAGEKNKVDSLFLE
jgi:hypothetical protein